MAQNTSSSTSENFAKQKASSLKQVQNYLKNHKPEEFNSVKQTAILRKKSNDLLQEATTDISHAKEKISAAMRALEQSRDARAGIKLIEISVQDETPLIIRDARNRSNNAQRGTEGAEIQYLNIIRAALDIAAIEGQAASISPEILQQAQTFMQEFHKTNKQAEEEGLSTDINIRLKQEKALIKLVEEGTNSLSEFLASKNIPNAYNKLIITKDFQGLSTEHYNAVTLSSINDKNSTKRTIIEADIGFRELSDKQKQEYQNILDPNTANPKWYEAMPWWEQELVKQYIPQITDGKHTIATQLSQIVGMKNTFEKVTAITEENSSNLQVLQAVKHAGTIASFAEDKSERSRIANLNIEQAQEWAGKNNKLHLNSYNSTGLGNKNDREIVSQLQKASKAADINYTNTAFNAARAVGNANVGKGVKSTLLEVQESFNKTEFPDKKTRNAAKIIMAAIEPKPSGLFPATRRFLKHPISSLGNPDKALQILAENNIIDQDGIKILESAIELRKSSDLLSKTTSIMRGNPSLETATKLAILNNNIKIAQEKGEIKGLSNIKAEEVIGMCKSGKDRTGLAMHDASARAVSEALGVELIEADKAMVKSGHGQQQAGGVYSCGSSAGCFGTKTDNKLGIGNAIDGVRKGTKNRSGRDAELVELIEKTAHGGGKAKLDKKGKNPDSTIGGYDKETQHIKEVEALKATPADPAKTPPEPVSVAELSDEVLQALNKEANSLPTDVSVSCAKNETPSQMINGTANKQNSAISK